MVKMFDTSNWAVPGILVGSGRKRILFGSFDGHELAVRSDDAVPLVGQTEDPEGEVHYSIYAVEVTDLPDGTESWGIPEHIGDFFDIEGYNKMYEVMQEIVQEGE